MKKTKLSIIALIMLGAVACKKDGSLPGSAPGMTSADAADVVAGSLSTNSSGLASISDDVTVHGQLYVDTHLACGSIRTDTLTRKSPAGANVTFSYGLGYTYALNCNASNVPDNLTGKVNYSGSFSGPHLSSANTGNVTFTLAGLSPTATSNVLNGTFLRSGSFASKTDTAKHGNTYLSITITNLTIRKSGRVITGGTATFSLTGSLPKNSDFSFTGTLVFNGDNTAKLTINGTNYMINLVTGEKIKV